MKRFLLFFVLIIGGCSTMDAMLRHRADARGDASTLGEYLAWRPSADQFVLFEINARQYVLAYGPYSRVFPSGPAGYVFDPDGKLVDWSWDIGDDAAFAQKWYARTAQGARVLTRTEVLTRVMTQPDR